MKQQILIRWIEGAEARAVCALATENPSFATFAALPKPHPSEATIDKPQLGKYLRQIGRRLVPLHRTRSAA